MIENNLPQPKQEAKEHKREITKIHFLVHPGYILESRYARNSYFGMETLLEDYIKKANSLGTDELMVIFAPKFGEDFVHDFRKKLENKEIPKKYVQAIREIDSVLSDSEKKGVSGNRAIVLADTDVFRSIGARFQDNREKVWSKILSIIEKRGFVLSKDVEAEAYGEYKDKCVSDVARNMRFASNSPLTGPAEINEKLTEKGHKLPYFGH